MKLQGSSVGSILWYLTSQSKYYDKKTLREKNYHIEKTLVLEQHYCNTMSKHVQNVSKLNLKYFVEYCELSGPGERNGVLSLGSLG